MYLNLQNKAEFPSFEANFKVSSEEILKARL